MLILMGHTNLVYRNAASFYMVQNKRHWWAYCQLEDLKKIIQWKEDQETVLKQSEAPE